MILYLNDEGISEDITEEFTEEITEEDTENDTEDTTQEIATQGDAYLIVSQQELNQAVEVLPKIYDLFSFWFLVWLILQMLSRIRRQFRKHTGEMIDKGE